MISILEEASHDKRKLEYVWNLRDLDSRSDDRMSEQATTVLLHALLLRLSAQFCVVPHNHIFFFDPPKPH